MFYQVSLFDCLEEEEIEPINSKSVVQEYLETLTDKTAKNDCTNAIVRYFIPAIGGPTPIAKKRCQTSLEEVNLAFQYLKNVSLERLANSPEITLEAIQNLELSKAQLFRTQRSLRELVAWSRAQNFLPINTVPQKYYKTIEVGRFANLPLKRGTLRTIYELYSQQLAVGDDQNDLTNAMLRYFIPATGGPLPVHKPALIEEVRTGLKHLETLPREYLQEAPEIATEALEALGMSLTQATRIRSALRGLIDWSIAENYLPDPHKLAPWGEIFDPPSLLPIQAPTNEVPTDEEVPNVKQIYDEFCKQIDKPGLNNNLQWVVVRYFVPACDGPVVSGKRASNQEMQAAMNYLEQLTIEQLFDALALTETQFDRAELKANTRTAGRDALKQLWEWCRSKGYFDSIQRKDRAESSAVQLCTFRKPGQRMQRKKPGLHRYRSEKYALGTQPDDYINLHLEQQIEAFQQWRLENGAAEGTVENEYQHILQVLGWLYRHEGVPLKWLRFEKLISKSKLRWSIRGYRTLEKYLWSKESGKEKADRRAKADRERINRYLKFTGGKSSSHCKRVALLIAMAKFIYQDIRGSGDYTFDRSIPVLKQLLDLQRTLQQKESLEQPSIPISKTSTRWEKAILAMEMQRRRADKFVIEIAHKKSRNGHRLQHRPNTAMANELQRFLSIAFMVAVFPSRSRTYYDLRIGETFKEGINPGQFFVPKAEFDIHGIRAEPKFYFHQLPEDYKTGRAMTAEIVENNGWWVEVPNVVFLDGKCLYDYIRRWLDWGREIKGALNHNFFFRQAHRQEPLDQHGWTSRIKYITERWTGIPIPGSSLRKMWSTCLSERRAPSEVITGATTALQHSEDVHSIEYDMHPTVEEIRPALEYNQVLVTEVSQELFLELKDA